MKPLPEFENEICRVWKMALDPGAPLALWTSVKNSLLIANEDIKLAYKLADGLENSAHLKAYQPWGVEDEHTSMTLTNPSSDPLELMIVELKEHGGSFPSIPIH
jgi:hypothetical protein